ncbi:hypothetical protein [Streptomyces xanthophaeus]|uniref:hypothetical protein n=1 Tax=Streptomyces xanthophaeus TaxID=67385 RepID=UPI00371ED7A3
MRKSFSTLLATVALTVAGTVTGTAPAGAAQTGEATVTGASSGTWICYRAYLQNQGWQDYQNCDGGKVGTEGQARHVEGLMIAAQGVGRLCVRAHVQDQGWDTYPTCSSFDGATVTVGTSGKNRAIEALEISVSGGEVAADAHLRNQGWAGWTGYGTTIWVGTTGENRPAEGFKFAVRN